jgi:hypothetical protein
VSTGTNSARGSAGETAEDYRLSRAKRAGSAARSSLAAIGQCEELATEDSLSASGYFDANEATIRVEVEEERAKGFDAFVISDVIQGHTLLGNARVRLGETDVRVASIRVVVNTR